MRFHHAILKASVLWTRLQKYPEKAKQAGAQFSYIRLYKLYELEYHLTKILLEIQFEIHMDICFFYPTLHKAAI